ncbi:hypothetical protein B0T20DRAFT_466920 [Sordaria brevicollis]|uniref:Uncharacterized protein n=1 Tax=Sordaria brevicollis TaxID=83679 RepID=A0AAE0PLA8_SORBR|nr:hypothetical protein B0T20DRAFT_466920 [Sordaria brevicollis]
MSPFINSFNIEPVIAPLCNFSFVPRSTDSINGWKNETRPWFTLARTLGFGAQRQPLSKARLFLPLHNQFPMPWLLTAYRDYWLGVSQPPIQGRKRYNIHIPIWLCPARRIASDPTPCWTPSRHLKRAEPARAREIRDYNYLEALDEVIQSSNGTPRLIVFPYKLLMTFVEESRGPSYPPPPLRLTDNTSSIPPPTLPKRACCAKSAKTRAVVWSGG